jgi:hypothetical protein
MLFSGTSWVILNTTTKNLKPKKMKKVTTIIISLLTIASSVFAGNNNPGNNTAAVLTVAASNNNVVLNWSSSNKSRFEIERSFYSNNFTTIATIPTAMTANSNFRINDNAAELAGRKIAYYRVKQIAADGTITYSNVTVVNLEGAEQSTITKNTSISFTAAQNGNAVIKIQSVTGKAVSVKNMIASKGNNSIEMESGLSKGIYTAAISVNGVVIDNQKIIVE